jgi:hypothetical protein
VTAALPGLENDVDALRDRTGVPGLAVAAARAAGKTWPPSGCLGRLRVEVAPIEVLGDDLGARADAPE